MRMCNFYDLVVVTTPSRTNCNCATLTGARGTSIPLITPFVRLHHVKLKLEQSLECGDDYVDKRLRSSQAWVRNNNRFCWEYNHAINQRSLA